MTTPDRPQKASRRLFAKGVLFTGVALMGLAGAGYITGFSEDAAARATANPLERFQEGVHFAEIDKPFLVGHNHVREWMWWGCVHCATFEPILNAWLKARGSSVVFERSPMPGSKARNLHAAMYEVAASLGDIEAMHSPFMAAVQERQLDKDRAESILRSAGVNPEQFWGLVENTGEAHVKGLMAEAVRSGIVGTPSIVVGGRYRVLTDKLTSLEEMLEVADFLIERGAKAG